MPELSPAESFRMAEAVRFAARPVVCSTCSRRYFLSDPGEFQARLILRPQGFYQCRSCRKESHT